MRRIRHQRVTIEVFREQPLAERDPFLLRHPIESRREPYLFRRLDDER